MREGLVVGRPYSRLRKEVMGVDSSGLVSRTLGNVVKANAAARMTAAVPKTAPRCHER